MLQRALRPIYRVLFRLTLRPFTSPRFSLGFRRRWTALVSRSLVGTPRLDRERLESGPVSGPLLLGAGSAGVAERPALLFAHGGFFVLGGPATHGGLAAHIAAASGADVYLPDYRLAPDHPYPAATDDLFAAYRGLLQRGYDPARIAIGGDSAGGALAISTALNIREMDLPAPAAMVLLSPVTDLSLSGPSVRAKAASDPLLTPEALADGYRSYAGGMALTDERISPLFADLSGLPPTLIQVGEDEILLDDSLRLADRAWAAGVEVELQRFPKLWHDFQLLAGTLEDARGAVDDIAAFLKRRWDLPG